MSVQTAKSQFSYELPRLSYIDAKWEEPNLRTAASPVGVREGGVAAWLSRQVATLLAWRRDSQAARQLASMSDYELMDIGLSRSDLSRVFDETLHSDLSERGKRA